MLGQIESGEKNILMMGQIKVWKMIERLCNTNVTKVWSPSSLNVKNPPCNKRKGHV